MSIWKRIFGGDKKPSQPSTAAAVDECLQAILAGGELLDQLQRCQLGEAAPAARSLQNSWRNIAMAMINNGEASGNSDRVNVVIDKRDIATKIEEAMVQWMALNSRFAVCGSDPAASKLIQSLGQKISMITDNIMSMR